MRAKEFIIESRLIVDVPNEEWLAGKIDWAKKKGRDSFGVPYLGSITARPSDRNLRLPVSLLKRLSGMRGEQQNVRKKDLETIMKIMQDTGKLPLMRYGKNGEEYRPFINVAWNGEAWVNEGNHRIMAAAALGWKDLPVELAYFDGGERVESGPLYPKKIGLQQGVNEIEMLDEGRSQPTIVVDVQPEYCGDNNVCQQIINFVQKQTGPVLMFVNAEEMGLTGDTVQSIRAWWEEQAGADYDEESDSYTQPIDWSRFQIVDKGYGYLRSWMDHGIEASTIISTIRELYQQKKSDSRELSFPPASQRTVQQSLIIGAIEEMDGDPLIVNWISLAQLKKFSGAYLVGGCRNECLREVEFLMNAFNIRYKRVDSLVYENFVEGRVKDIDIDLQDQHWEAVVGFVQDGVRWGRDADRMSTDLYRWAGGEMFDVDAELEHRGFSSVADLADHIRDNGGKYRPPEFDLRNARSLQDIERLERRKDQDWE